MRSKSIFERCLLHGVLSKRILSTASTAVETRPPTSFHKRVLPDNLIALSSKEGRELFREALADGTMESYFPLSEQFVTQSEPSYCSLRFMLRSIYCYAHSFCLYMCSSLAMVLNALNYDPGRVWKGAWRWVSEETLQCESRDICGHSLERVQKFGMNFRSAC